MKKAIVYILISLFAKNSQMQPNAEKTNPKADEIVIIAPIKNYDLGLKNQDVADVIKDYNAFIGFTNAFGERVLAKAELHLLLADIFSLDLVKAGKQNYVENSLEFMVQDVLLPHSQTMWEDQKLSDGTSMSIQHNYLREYKTIDKAVENSKSYDKSGTCQTISCTIPASSTSNSTH